MSEKEKNRPLYFSHDTNTRQDPKVAALLNKYGFEGYGRFWALVEILADQKGYKLPIQKEWQWHGTAAALQMEIQKAKEFIQDLIENLELFRTDGEYFWSDSLLRRMELREEKSKKLSEAGKKGADKKWGKDSQAIARPKPSYSQAIATPEEENGQAVASKVKESKENNIKKSSDTHQLLIHHAENFKDHFEEEYKINWAKESSISKKLLESYDLEKLKKMNDFFFSEFDDAWVKNEAGYGFNIFSLKINDIIQQKKKEISVEKQKTSSGWGKRLSDL